MTDNPVVVYEDKNLIAVSKPSGQIVIPGRGSAEEPLKAQVSGYCGKEVFVVHRLDGQASGLVVFAKEALTHRELCLRFELRQVHKTYLALVQGIVVGDGIIEEPIREFGSGRMGAAKGGKPSVTRYRVSQKLKGATLLEVEPVTGRRHQIRVHLYAIGHPIIGDALYGKNRPVGGVSRLMLHALEISSLSGGIPTLRAQPPEDFVGVLRQFGLTNAGPTADYSSPTPY